MTEQPQAAPAPEHQAKLDALARLVPKDKLVRRRAFSALMQAMAHDAKGGS